jgi:hypothetical protein
MMRFRHYYCLNHYTYFLMACLLICIFIFQGCQEVDEDLVFELVRQHYPECRKIKPAVVHVKKVKMVNGTETKGLFLPALNMILLAEDADLDVLVHEYRHACGDLLGEKINLAKYF